MATMMRIVGLALGVLALAVPLLHGGVMESREIDSCQPGAGVCGEALGALQAGSDRIASYF